MEWTKDERSEYVDRRLNEVGYPVRGRAARIAEDCATSHSQATNWLGGAVPREPEEVKRVADILNLEIMEWVYGLTQSAVDTRKLMKAVNFAKTLEQMNPDKPPMTPSQFTEIVMMDYDNKIAGAALMETLAVIAEVRDRGAVEGNGTTGQL